MQTKIMQYNILIKLANFISSLILSFSLIQEAKREIQKRV